MFGYRFCTLFLNVAYAVYTSTGFSTETKQMQSATRKHLAVLAYETPNEVAEGVGPHYFGFA